ncbi:zeta toxin family protein [Thermobifida halotolerans]|uniref:UDP-N-acetylglucosamine kinase n=1 Tax=Thermobifida halotolerans TaxID=483545 RepID=A0A399G644_9ACTN|nr:zeta toxin family protein [Thermobifida halotolerans]UOE21175.1 zeta toxin family protein [Thermobifida halotolerans]
MLRQPPSAETTFYSYSPTSVLYDVFDSTATQLSGAHLTLIRRAADDGEGQTWRTRRRAVEERRRAVDPDDRDALVQHTRLWLSEIAALRGRLSEAAAPESHHVSPEDLESVFEDPDDGVREFVFHGHAPSPSPVLVLLGAQPAAGKSRVQAALVRRRPDLVPVTGDRLRAFHPHHSDLMRQDPLAMPNATAQACGAWVRMCIGHALDNRHSLLLEGTFRDPRTTLATAERFAGAGYRVEVVAIGVREEVSRLDSVNRYLSPGSVVNRWTPANAHDLGYRMCPRTVAACEASPHVHRITVVDQSGAAHFDNERGPDGAWTGPPGAEAALLRLRERPFDSEEARIWLYRRDDYTAAVAGRGELTPTTLPTFASLCADADRVAEYAYSGPWDFRLRRRNAARQRMYRRLLDSAARNTG